MPGSNQLRRVIACSFLLSCVNDPATKVCPQGLTACGEECVDTSLDRAHCGGCSIPCPELCSIGTCATECLGGTTQCGDRCVDTQNDPAHCGGCDTSCNGEVCVMGGCATLCDNGLLNCDGACVDIQVDAAHCGDCNQPCGGGASCIAGSCTAALSCNAILNGDPNAASGVHTIDVDSDGPGAPFDVHCDMSLAGGGWTLALNLDTSDGHVMWWVNPLWTDSETYGSAPNALTEDHKSEAYLRLTNAAEILLVVHEEGTVVGWKRFGKADGASMQEHMQTGDNVLVGSMVLSEDTAGVWPGERVVRLSTQLFANHCVPTGGGSCTSGGIGSPDGDRIGSNEAAPSDNSGGGLGNWHDMNFCCMGQNYGSGKVCNGAAFRTASEAQAGWSPCYGGAGHFGTDTFAPATNACVEAPCSSANYSAPSGIEYDYALYLR